jgi:hypothetical protein
LYKESYSVASAGVMRFSHQGVNCQESVSPAHGGQWKNGDYERFFAV